MKAIADPTARENNTKNIVAVCDVGSLWYVKELFG
jgi:hypothetical protein